MFLPLPEAIRPCRRLLPVIVGAVLMAISGCSTGPSPGTVSSDSDASIAGVEEEIPGGNTPFDHLNIVRVGGFHLAAPEGWSISRVGDTAIYLEPPGSPFHVAVRSSHELGEGVGRTITELDDHARRRGETARLSGHRVVFLWHDEDREIPDMVVWPELSPPLTMGYAGRSDRIVEEAPQLRAIAESLRFDPYHDCVRIVEDLFAFHSYGSGWEFIADIPDGALFGWFARRATGDNSWDIKPEIAIALQRGQLTDTEGDESGEAAVISESILDSILPVTGPIFSGQTVVTVTESDGNSEISLVPLLPEEDSWEARILVSGNVAVSDGAFWEDHRLLTFFGGCFVPAP